MSFRDQIPTLHGSLNRELLHQALECIVKQGGSPQELADCFEELVPQIDRLGGNFTARRSRGVDGAHIFVGEVGHSLVISPEGLLYRGALEFTPAQNGLPGIVLNPEGHLVPNYDVLVRWEP